jgi:hypothetical protein
MTKLLEQAFGQLSRLPEADQDVIAEALIGLLPNATADLEWESLFRDPRSEEVLKRMLHDVETARGEVGDGDPGDR